MQIIADHKFTEFAVRHSTSRPSIIRWLNLMRERNFKSVNKLREVFPHDELPYTKGLVDILPYPATTTQWLIRLLELFTSIVNRTEDLSQVVVTEAEYHQLLEFLDDLICSVGEDEKHPLTATMTLIGGLIKAYEDQHFPKLNTLFPELTAELSESVSVETNGNNSDARDTLSGQIRTDFVNVLFSIGCLLWTGGQSDQAISAYDLAISINPDYPSIHTCRGEAKSGLNDIKGAKADLQYALKLAVKQGEDDFSYVIKERLKELDIIEATFAYLSESKFSEFSIIRECGIQIGTLHSRVDFVLCDAEGNYITIAECKYITSSDNDAYRHEPLKSFLCATDSLFGIFAPSINPDSWIFYENLRHNRFQQITRTDFEEQVVATSE